MLQRKSIEISMNLIHPNPEQPRKHFSEAELEDLKVSITEYGVLQPIIVKKDKEGGYFLIAGERRFRAAKLAGLTKIPAVIKDFSDRDAAVIAVVENVQREDLSFIEEAWAYKKLLDEYGLTQGELASKIGKKQSTISNKLRILTLPQDILEKLTDENLTERHGRALLKIEDAGAREKILQRVIANQLNVKQTEKLIEDYLTKENLERRKKNKINYISYKIYMNTIYKTFRQIKEMEEGVSLQESDQGEYVEVKITIPKNKGCFT
ncbi:MAG: ParB/RepB/Spo0J family partition protein [Firmicutes bacterium]|nr:ParB/RepB/Spo0J family partition protein [Bacillota bacterium]